VITRAVEDTPQLWASATPINAGSGRDVDVIVAFRLFARQKTAVGIAVGGLAVAVGLCTALFTGSASRARVVRQMLTESLVPGTLGAAGGLMLASWRTPVIAGLVNAPATYDTSPDARTYAFLAAAAVITGLTAGLAPARYGARGDLRSALGSDRSHAPAGTGRFNATVIGLQAAIAMLMLVLGASLTRGAWLASAIDPGIDLDRLLEVRWTIHASLGRAPGQQIQDVGAQRLLALPVVEQTAVSGFSPLGGSSRRLGLDGGRVSAYVKAVSTG
jgi:hypothetical protein